MRYKSVLILLFFFIGCKSDPQKKQFDIFHKKTPNAAVIGSVICKSDLQQSYALYLPANYSPDVAYPLMVCFDPHGSGSFPINLMKNQAEKLGMVLVGSNNIKNGLSQDEITKILNVLLSDIKTNVNIDEKRIYLAGFSGGARVALSALFTQSGIRGVIACSGSIPASYIPKNIYIVGIGGSYDMNFAEMVEMERGFSADSYNHILLTFAGKHNWPPSGTLSAAMDWLKIGEMKDNLIPLDHNIIKEFATFLYNDTLKKIQKYYGCKQLITTLGGLTDVSLYQQILKQFGSDEELQNELIDEIRNGSIEKAQQKLYQESFNTKPAEWWKNEVSKLNKAIYNLKNPSDIALNMRLLAYISLYSYSACNYAKKAGDINTLGNFLEIYGMADPQNPDYFYFLACYNALKKNKKETLEAILTAKKLGFYDHQKFLNDTLFTTLINKPELVDVLK